MTANSKRALIVVDVQNDFCPGGSLAVAHGDEVVAPLNKLIREFLERGEPVFKSRDWHPARTKHFAAYGGAWPVHGLAWKRSGSAVWPQTTASRTQFWTLCGKVTELKPWRMRCAPST